MIYNFLKASIWERLVRFSLQFLRKYFTFQYVYFFIWWKKKYQYLLWLQLLPNLLESRQSSQPNPLNPFWTGKRGKELAALIKTNEIALSCLMCYSIILRWYILLFSSMAWLQYCVFVSKTSKLFDNLPYL